MAAAAKSNMWTMLGLSGLVHAGAIGVFAVTYTPPKPGPPPGSKVLSGVRMVSQGQPPRPEPKKPPKPEPPPEEPPPDVEQPPKQKSKPSRRKGPPPPPPECPGCAKLPAANAPVGKPGKSAVPVGVPGGVPGGVVGGVPGGVVGGVVGGTFDGTAIGDRKTEKVRPPEPLEAVMARSMFAPDPDPKLLAKTATGLMKRGAGVNKTFFCVRPDGKTEGVKTTRKFPGDPEIDRICRDTVKRWRFQALVIGGKKVRTCTTVRFEISFE